MKYITLLLFVLCLNAVSGYSQTIEWQIPGTDTIYNAKFKKFKDICLKKMNTESHIESKKAFDAFMEKLNFSGKRNELSTETPLAWAKENLSKTDFATFEEAEKSWQRVLDTGLVEVKENFYYYEAIAKLHASGDNQIFMDVMQEIKYEYPGKL